MGTWSDGLTSPVSPRGQRQAYEDESNTDWMLMLEYPDQPWREQAACRGMDASWWFPTRGEPSGDAIAVCGGCSVRLDCLNYALDRPEPRGTWGGLSEKERRRLRRQRRAQEAA